MKVALMGKSISMEKVVNRCGKCQQFTRTPDNQKDICGAWDQPTIATRQACEFFLSKKPQRERDK